MTKATIQAKPADLMTPALYRLVERAQDSRAHALGRAEVELLTELANAALTGGDYHAAYCAVEALLCQTSFFSQCGVDRLVAWADSAFTTSEITQGLLDRLESYDHFQTASGVWPR